MALSSILSHVCRFADSETDRFPETWRLYVQVCAGMAGEREEGLCIVQRQDKAQARDTVKYQVQDRYDCT